MNIRSLALGTALSLLGASIAAQPIVPDTLPEGRWTGSIKTRTTPDVDRDGEWSQEVALLHCKGEITLLRKRDDGTYTTGFRLELVPFRRIFTFVYFAAESQGPEGWVESQIWTLVDARPKEWTLSQSRAVFNHDMKPENPWLSFRWLGLGRVEYDKGGCEGYIAK
jgi:hypothetical protein